MYLGWSEWETRIIYTQLLPQAELMRSRRQGEQCRAAGRRLTSRVVSSARWVAHGATYLLATLALNIKF